MTDYATYVRDTPAETGLAFYKDITPDMSDEEISHLNDALNTVLANKGFTDVSDAAEMKTYREFLQYQQSVDKVSEVSWPDRTWKDDFLAKVALIGPSSGNEALKNWARGLENTIGDEFRKQGLTQEWLMDHFLGYREMLKKKEQIDNLPKYDVTPEVAQETATQETKQVLRPETVRRSRPGRPGLRAGVSSSPKQELKPLSAPVPPDVTAKPEIATNQEASIEPKPAPRKRRGRPGRRFEDRSPPQAEVKTETPSLDPVEAPESRPQLSPSMYRTREPEKVNNPPTGKDRVPLPEFLRIADEKRRSGNKLKTSVKNVTETALPKKERIAANTTFEVGAPVTAAPPSEIVAQAAMMMDPPMHLVDPMKRTRPYTRPGRPGKRARQAEELGQATLPLVTEPDAARTPEVAVEKMPEPVAPVDPTPEPQFAAANEICGNRKFPRGEAASLAKEVIRNSKIKDLVQSVNDMQLSQDDRNKIEGDVNLVTGKSTFNAWMTIEFSADRQVSSITLDHWEYGLDRPVKFDQIHQIDGEFQKAGPNKPSQGAVGMTIKQGEPIRPPKPKQAIAPQNSGLKPPSPGIRRPEDKPRQTAGGMKR